MDVSDEAINAVRAAVALRCQSVLLNRLGALLVKRSAVSQAAPELPEESISILQEAFDCNQQKTDRVISLQSLGNAYGIRYHRTGLSSDLKQAIKCAYDSIEIASDGGVSGTALLYNLANGLGSRYST